MAQANRPSPVKLIMGTIFSDEGILIKAKVNLNRKFGPFDCESPIFSFDFTPYYEQEMGQNLKRQFFSFQKLINPQKLAAIKVYTNCLEKKFSLKSPPARRINLDPGYICASKLVLASCKDFSHRAYLGRGIYAEVTLHFRKGSFAPWPWTYPDYQTQDYLQLFNKIRAIYLSQLPR